MTARYYCYDLMSLWITILFIKSRYWYGSNAVVNSEILVVCLGTCGQPQCNLWDVVQIKKFSTGAAMLP